MNGLYLSGNLTKDPESFDYTTKEKEDKQGVRLSIAYNHNRDLVSYFDVSYFGSAKAVDSIMTHLSKGSRVHIAGQLKQDRWEKDGEKHSKVYILAEEVNFHRPKDEE